MASSSKLVDSAPHSSLPQHSRHKSCGDGTSCVRAGSSERHRLPSSSSGRIENWRTPLGSTPPLRVACSHFSDDQSSTTSSVDTTSTMSRAVALTSAMARVLAVDPNAGRCLLTDSDVDVQLAYCLPRDLELYKLENLESAWNLEHGSLNADSRYNMFPLTKQFRRLFDDGDYILIPTTEILGVYGANRSIPVGADFPNVPNGLFEYTLMPRPSLQEVTIHRPSALRNTIAHNYPFEKLGTLKSHLHPRFVIWNLGHQIDQALLPFREALRHLEAVNAFDTPGKYELLSRLLDAHQIYEKWSEERVPPRPRPNLGLAPSVSSSQQTRRRRAIPPSMSATCAYGMPALTKRNLKELGNSSCDDSMPWHFTITRWQALCEVASCADEGCGIYPDTFGNDDDDSSDLECDFDADTADVEMGYAVPFQDGIGDDVPQAEMLLASDAYPRPPFRTCSMPPSYAETPSSPRSWRDASSSPPRDASSPSPCHSSLPSCDPSSSSSSVQIAPSPPTPPPGPYRVLGSTSCYTPSSGKKYGKRAFVEISRGDDVQLACGDDVQIADGDEWDPMPERRCKRTRFGV